MVVPSNPAALQQQLEEWQRCADEVGCGAGAVGQPSGNVAATRSNPPAIITQLPWAVPGSG
jgi:hypothetical protein